MTGAGARVFVDVDGVINAYSGKMHVPSWGWPRENGQYVRVMGFGIVYSPDMIRRLEDVTDRDDVEALWLTTWVDHARDDLAPVVGIGSDWEVVPREPYEPVPLPYAGGYGTSGHGGGSADGWWKLNAMQHLNEGYEGKIVWVDDDIKFFPAAREWIESANLDILAISPRTETGITLAQMRRIEEYISED